MARAVATIALQHLTTCKCPWQAGWRCVAPDKDLALHIWAGKTVEVRRSEAADARGVAPTSSDLEHLFFTAVSDRRRLQAGLPLMPAAVPPPPPVTECAPRSRHFLPLGLCSCL